MKDSKHFILVATLIVVASVAAACSPRPRASTAPAAEASPAASPSQAKLGRAELWGAYCSRCHTMRPRTEFSPAQWSVIVNHMRTIADMPGEDYRRLLEYLADRSANSDGTGGHP